MDLGRELVFVIISGRYTIIHIVLPIFLNIPLILASRASITCWSVLHLFIAPIVLWFLVSLATVLKWRFKWHFWTIFEFLDTMVLLLLTLHMDSFSFFISSFSNLFLHIVKLHLWLADYFIILISNFLDCIKHLWALWLLLTNRIFLDGFLSFFSFTMRCICIAALLIVWWRVLLGMCIQFMA